MAFHKRLHNDSDSILRILTPKTDFNTIETYKTIRTNVMFSLPKTEAGKVIAITSSSPGEGKTTTSINLAITFAQMGAKVILMDCDMRKSRIHRYLGMERDAGISNVLCGFTSFEKAVVKNVRDNLDVLTAGEIPPNPAELLGSKEYEALLCELREKYDYIFIDTPPITIVTDGVIVAELCDGIIVGVRENFTTYDVLDDAMDALYKSGTKIIGVIMLGSESKAKRYGYYKRTYRYRYGYKKYGYNYKYSDKDNDFGKKKKK